MSPVRGLEWEEGPPVEPAWDIVGAPGFSELTEGFVMPNRLDGSDTLRGDAAAQRNRKPSH